MVSRIAPERSGEPGTTAFWMAFSLLSPAFVSCSHRRRRICDETTAFVDCPGASHEPPAPGIAVGGVAARGGCGRRRDRPVSTEEGRSVVPLRKDGPVQQQDGGTDEDRQRGGRPSVHHPKR